MQGESDEINQNLAQIPQAYDAAPASRIKFDFQKWRWRIYKAVAATTLKMEQIKFVLTENQHSPQNFLFDYIFFIRCAYILQIF